jgi:hypothetical protein
MELQIPELTPEQEEEIKNNLHADQSYKMKNNNRPTQSSQANA